MDESNRLRIREERRKRRERKKKQLLILSVGLALVLVCIAAFIIYFNKARKGSSVAEGQKNESVSEKESQVVTEPSETPEDTPASDESSDPETQDTDAEDTEAEGGEENESSEVCENPERPAVDSGYVSTLPMLYIDAPMESLTSAPKETIIDGSYALYGPDCSGMYYAGDLKITGYGRQSWEQDKKCFSLYLGEEQELLGMGEAAHWALIACRTDPSFMRNHMASTLSEKWGMLASKGTWVDVVVNGSEYGCFYLTECAEVGKNRVDIMTAEVAAKEAAEAIAAKREDLDQAELETALKRDLSWVSTGTAAISGEELAVHDYYSYDGTALVRGGYLLEINGYMDYQSTFYTNELVRPIMVVSPQATVTNAEMMAYLKKLLNAFDRGLKDGTYRTTLDDAAMSVYEIVDMDTLVSYFWLNEIFMNADGWYRSFFFYKDIDTDGKYSPFKIGPVWDVDYSSGGYRDNKRPYQTNGWGYETYWPTDQMTMNYGRYLVHDPAFVKAAYDFYKDPANRQAIMEMLESCEMIYGELEESASHDAARWGLVRNDFRTEVTALEEWMNKRIAWLDDQTESYDKLWKAFGN